MDGGLIRVCALAILCAVAGLVLRQIRGEFAGLLRIGGAVLIFGGLILEARSALEEVTALFSGEGLEAYATVMLRALGIALLTRACTDICRDCGESSVAGGVELAGKLAILALCVPLIKEIIGYATALMQME